MKINFDKKGGEKSFKVRLLFVITVVSDLQTRVLKVPFIPIIFLWSFGPMFIYAKMPFIKTNENNDNIYEKGTSNYFYELFKPVKEC